MEINKFLELFGKVANKYSIDQMDIDNDGTITEAELETLLNPKTEKDEDVSVDLKDKETSGEETDNNVNKNSVKENKTEIDYERIKTAYKNYITKMADLKKEAEEIYESNQQYEDSPDAKWSVTAIYNDLKENLYLSAFMDVTCSTNIPNTSLDINKDGIINAKDLALFSTNVDLTGDGAVSKGERQFLQELKDYMAECVYKQAEDTKDIDTLIDSLNALGKDYVTKRKENAKKDIATGLAYSTKKGPVEITYSDDEGGGLHSTMVINSYLPTEKAMKDGFITKEQYLGGTVGELKEVLEKAIDYYSPANQYLRYIEKYKLSKEKLEEILNKINSSSSSVQSQLSEVKKAVEEKLEAME